MSDRASLIRRLRRLIDDVGHGYSQSAPGWSADLSASALAAPAFAVLMDDASTPVDVPLGSVASLSTGPAIARAIQTSIRAADPGLALPTPVRTPAFDGVSCIYDAREGYVIRSGTIGNLSVVHVLPPTVGDDVTGLLKLGLNEGGYESPAKVEWSDTDLGEMMDLSLAEQNNTGEITSWTYSTLPSEYENAIVYRTWASLVDTMLGRAAWFHPQKVASEEVTPNTVFDNLFKLAEWLKDRLNDIVTGLDSQIECSTVVVWDREEGRYVGNNAYDGEANTPRILNILPGSTESEAILEFAEILTPDTKIVYVGMNTSSGVFDQTVFTDAAFDPSAETTGLSTGAILVRKLSSTKHVMVKVTGLAADTDYYFAMQTLDQNGNRRFSSEMKYTTPELPN
jgi:hypothetical protein